MNLIRCLVIAVLVFGSVACDRSANSPTQSTSPVTDTVHTTDRPQEAVSFGGEPLYQYYPTDRRTISTINRMIEAIEAKDALSEDDYVELGYRYMDGGRYRDAIEAYTRGIHEYPNSFKLRRHRGHRYINVRELDKAIADLQAAVELMGDTSSDVVEYKVSGEANGTYEHWVWYHIGLFHYLNGDYQEAANAYQRCVDTATNPSVLVGATDWLYNAQQKAGNVDAASAAIAAIAPDLETNREHPYFKRVMLYKGEFEPEDILDIDKPAVDWTGVDITVAYGVGNWYAFGGDRETAEKIHRKILETPFWNAWAYVAADREYSPR